MDVMISDGAVDETLVSALKSDYKEDSNDGEVSTLEIDQIPKSLEKDLKSIKALIRSHGFGMSTKEQRMHFWRGFLLRMEGGEDAVSANKGLYEDTLVTCFGTKDMLNYEPNLPSIVDPDHANSYCLSANGRISVARILTCYVYNNPDVQRCPILYPLAAVLRHYLVEDEVYGLLCALAGSRQPKFLSQSQQQHSVDWRTAMEINKQHNKKTLNQIQAAMGGPSNDNESNNNNLSSLFSEWIWWLFEYIPLPHISRIIDCFLIEGQKVLFRASMALIRYFGKHCLRSSEANKRWTQKIKSEGIRRAFAEFCRNIPVSPNTLLDKGFAFKNFSKSSIQKTSLTIEIDLKAKGIKEGSNSSPNDSRNRRPSADGLPNAKAMEDIKGVSETLCHKQGMSTPQPRQKSMGIYPIHHLKSEFLSPKDFISIWKHLPERMTTAMPKMAYSSNEHGTSLTTFYAKSEKFEPTILIIKAIGGEMFGAYCSTTWAERNFKDDRGNRQTYFGTGETFLFRVVENGCDGKKENNEEKECEIFPWIGKEKDLESDETLTKAERHARSLFMSGQHDMIAIGGGDGNGIYLDRNLMNGKTESCLTFGNPPLCAKGDFQVAVIEVYGLKELDL